MTGTVADKSKVDAIFSLWPKGNGDDHRIMFRKMSVAGGSITKALISWGQNPAVTEPNQGAIRDGLYNLDLLVVADMFETETAACDRKATGVTYLIPAASHVEVGGSATNSGRTLQWRYQARKPAGNSKADLELLVPSRLRARNTCDTGGAFSHIKAVWGAAGSVTYTSVYDELYGAPYANGWTPGSGDFEALSGIGRSCSADRQRRLDCDGHRLRVGLREDLPRDGTAVHERDWRHDLDLHRRVQPGCTAEHHERQAPARRRGSS